MLVGYKLVDSTGTIHGQWGGVWGQCPDIPNPLLLPNGDQACGVSTIGPVNSEYSIVGWYMDEPVVVPASISRRQCATQLRNDGMITQNEALAMASMATVPAAIMSYFDTMDPADKDNALLAFTATEYLRSNPLLNAIMTANGLTTEQIDQFFISAGSL